MQRPQDFDYNPKRFIEPVTALSLHKKMVSASSSAGVSNPQELPVTPKSADPLPSKPCPQVKLIPQANPSQMQENHLCLPPNSNSTRKNNPSLLLNSKSTRKNNPSLPPNSNSTQNNTTSLPPKSHPQLNSNPPPRMKRNPLVQNSIHVKPKSSPSSSSKKIVTAPTMNFKVCQYCGRKYAHSSSLSKHITKVHKEMTAKSRSISCGICDDR